MSRRVKYAVVAVVALALVSGLARGLWWWTHPTLLSGSAIGGSSTGPTTPVAKAVTHFGVAGEPWRKPFGNPPDEVERITFDGAEAHFRRNSAGAHVDFYICTASEPDGAIGVWGADISDFCTKLRPLRDGTVLEYGSPEYVVAKVTPTRAGSFDIDYVTLDYSRPGFFGQHGKDDVVIEYSKRVSR